MSYDTTKLLNACVGYHAMVDKMEAENAELRNLLRDSLEWLDDYGMRMSGTSNLVSRIETALRKEAQRWGDDQIMRQHLSEGGTPT